MINFYDDMKICCCFCSKNFPINLIENHVLTLCHPLYENTVNEKTKIPEEYNSLFAKIKNGDFNKVIKINFFENFNQKAMQKFEQFNILYKCFKNKNLYSEKLQIIKPFDYDIPIYLADFILLLNKKVEKNREKINYRNHDFLLNLNNVICFFCGKLFIMNIYSKHCLECYEKSKCKNLDICLVPKNFLLEETIDQLSKNIFDASYTTFLLREYNENAKSVYQTLINISSVFENPSIPSPEDAINNKIKIECNKSENIEVKINSEDLSNYNKDENKEKEDFLSSLKEKVIKFNHLRSKNGTIEESLYQQPTKKNKIKKY
jgi:hypothetical protein